ncbi:hypothetical protein NDU88_013064 [Pleurodeles waltl]|uniref:Uncharacterized protein n=1 Tax=Pleurodeles waltl TaxID=8319 RepID=A0AAV7R1U2_PLEWA|nr:hypothetical protein NDU88_013026 [Pleurodeles waltl]KAJ1146805.1 hypothetical protein NDU88_013064 [Pleurodeles waltl]
MPASWREKRKKERNRRRDRGRWRAEPKATTTGKEVSKTPSPRQSINGELKGIRGRKYRFLIAATRETNPREKAIGDTSHAPGGAWLPQALLDSLKNTNPIESWWEGPPFCNEEIEQTQSMERLTKVQKRL